MAISALAARTVSSFCRAITTISAIIVLGITAWAVESSKSVTVIYTLTIATITVFFVFVLLGIGFFTYKKPIFHSISFVLELFLAFLWIAAFVLVVNNWERVSCRVNRWHGMVVCARQHTVEAFSFIAFFFTLVGAIFSFLAFYALTTDSLERDTVRREKPTASQAEAGAIPQTHPNNGHINNGHVNNGPIDNGHINTGHVNNGYANEGVPSSNVI